MRLTGLDGAFLALESPTTHLHVVGTMVLDPTGVPGGVGFRRIRSLVEERIHAVPPFRRRLAESPLGLQHPMLVEDPDFDIDAHVRRTAVPGPGGDAELAGLVADLAGRPLDRGRPLWELHVVEGLADGRIGLVAKVHHAVIDGASGAEVLAGLFDLSPDPTPRPLFDSGPAWPRPSVTRGPGADARRGDAGGDREGTTTVPRRPSGALPGELDRLRQVVAGIPDQLDAVARSVAWSLRSARAAGSKGREAGPGSVPSPFQAPRTSINGAISPHRCVAFADLALADVRRVGRVLGGTANDVVLAVTAGALRDLFAARGEDPDSSLVALVPRSVRTEAERGALGNRVTGLLVSLATGVADPVARLRHIRDGMRQAKERSEAAGTDVVASLAGAAAPVLASGISRLVTDLRVFDRVAPPFNLVVSNVPGPDVPLYLAGAKMVSMHPLGPIVEGVGLNVTVFSYRDTVHVGIQACRELVPDVDAVASGMERALTELVAAAGRRDRPVPWWHAEVPA